MRIIFILFFIIPSLLFSQTGLDKKPSNQQHAFSPNDLLSLRRISDMQLSPDDKFLLFGMKSPNLKTNTSENNLFIISIDGKVMTQITDTDDSEYNARWSKDGKEIYYISTELGAPQIFKYNLNTKKSKAITSVVKGVSNMELTPINDKILFTSEVKVRKDLEKIYNKYTSFNAMKFNYLPIRHWDTWEDNMASHVFYLDTKSGKITDIMEGQIHDSPLLPFGGGEEIAWSPSGNEIAYTSKKVNNMARSTNSDIYIYDLKSKKTSNITKGMVGYDKAPLYSPDGNWIAFHSQERPGFEADKIRLMLYNRNTGEIKEMLNQLDQWIGSLVWSNDSETIYFESGVKGRVHLYSLDLENNTYKKLTNDKTNDNGGLAISNDGMKLFFGRTSITYPTDYYSLELKNKQIERVTSVNDDLLSDIKDIKIEERMIESTDGKKVHTWVLYPPDFDENKQYPMLTYCQGGPQGTISNYFSYRWNLYLMASQGYVVCAPNRRGMPGFGQEWNDQISGDWNGQAMDDILAATDNVMSEDYVDNENVGAVGASFGGYTVFWMQGNDNGRFNAFISHCGVFNLTSMYGVTEELFFPDWEFGGPYWEDDNKEFYEDQSPHNYVENWDTPMLVITGMKDFRVPYTQSLEAYTAAQLHGIDTELLVFPDENHWVLSLQNAYVWQSEFFKFLDKHLKN
jgi:dipeptidyl aminopeptidase/acylaminoacyl peptidase